MTSDKRVPAAPIDKGPRGIQSIEVGYRLLVAIQMGPGAVALKDIAQRAGVTASAAHNYLISLARTGLVRNDGRGLYRLGPGLAALGMTAARDVDHFELIRAAVAELSEETGMGVALLIWSNGPVILLHCSTVAGRIFDLRNGPVDVLHTAGGHVFVSHLPESLVLPVMMGALQADGLPASEEAARRRIAEIRASVVAVGHAVVALRALPTYLAVSVPIWDAHGQMAYALTITSPESLVDTSAASAQVAALRERGRSLSRLLGAPADRWRG